MIDHFLSPGVAEGGCSIILLVALSPATIADILSYFTSVSSHKHTGAHPAMLLAMMQMESSCAARRGIRIQMHDIIAKSSTNVSTLR